MTVIYEVEEYVAPNGKNPYADWFDDLKDVVGKTRIEGRIVRASFGNFGDWKSVTDAKGVFEMRENYGPGYRIYYSIIGQKIILLLAGSTKRDQDRTIKKAKEYMADYERRVRQ